MDFEDALKEHSIVDVNKHHHILQHRADQHQRTHQHCYPMVVATPTHDNKSTPSNPTANHHATLESCWNLAGIIQRGRRLDTLPQTRTGARATIHHRTAFIQVSTPHLHAPIAQCSFTIRSPLPPVRIGRGAIKESIVVQRSITTTTHMLGWIWKKNTQQSTTFNTKCMNLKWILSGGWNTEFNAFFICFNRL